MYVVIFRAQVREGADREELDRLDRAAWGEAVLSGGLLEYVRGSDDGAKASMCVWESEADARRASGLPHHRAAAGRAGEFYESFRITTFQASPFGVVENERSATFPG